MVQLRSWMIPAEACPGTFVTLKGACGKTTTTNLNVQGWRISYSIAHMVQKIIVINNKFPGTFDSCLSSDAYTESLAPGISVRVFKT